MARLTVVVIAIIGVFLARNPNSSVFRIVSFAWAGFGATFGAVMLFSLFWKRTNRNGALAGMVTGAVTVIVWNTFGWFGLYEIIPGFLFALIAIVIFSLIGQKPSQAMKDIFDEVQVAVRKGEDLHV